MPDGQNTGFKGLKLYNTLSREKEAFSPIDPANVRMYVCGPTVYDFAHIGNARPAIVFDVLFRLLRYLYGADHVTYVRNITDVDDKINARAAERGISIRELTEETARVYHDDIDALNVLRPTVEPRATEHIAEMIAMVEKLVENGHAYAADGHVLFDVPSMDDYGRLSRRSLDEMQAGARVEVAPYKKNAMDFVLWKPSAEGEPGWDSPWGRGRPGWHLECSAMSWKHLGKVFDIHGGGIDLQFPHHENEIAQSRCCHGTDVMANYWLHNGFLQVEGEKMSKSLGNFITIHDLLKDWPGEVLRLNMLRTHYRQPIDWTAKGLSETAKILDGWYDAIGDAGPAAEPDADVVAALTDDLNTPKAIAALHGLRAAAKGGEGAASLKASANLIGLLEETASDWTARTAAEPEVDAGEIERLIEARKTARKDKNFAEADRIRDDLAASGIVLKDGPQGTTWEVRR
ncbi:cysteinyl-tRNA synthetase [Rhodobium orientis]|uniref:Cysteine--tRNA ligase n=1 Tax=Rhodobium orientis TaxID=34017 RepID=A0A327JVS0_9HYPH|nr:cysteine--tRNA ligase [Rhodobium orientis]MBB4304024.1 cysteinyl-tRNA synthetase [Rhodobium orientis]MBK5950766.1 cysteine--tRNA ligase [Rhodobium orientis]RAI29563.1 cysteine--tRNA ligase [Rhodobium orientis]